MLCLGTRISGVEPGPLAYRSWEQKGWEEPAPSFPSYNQQGAGQSAKSVQALMAAVRDQSGGHTLLNDLQQLLNDARKAETRLERAIAQRQLGKQQAFQEKMKVAWMKEQRNYLKNSERQDQEIEAATQQQAAARALVCQAWKGQDQGHPAVTAEQARESEWKRDDYILGGRSGGWHGRSSTPGPRADSYNARPSNSTAYDPTDTELCASSSHRGGAFAGAHPQRSLPDGRCRWRTTRSLEPHGSWSPFDRGGRANAWCLQSQAIAEAAEKRM